VDHSFLADVFIVDGVAMKKLTDTQKIFLLAKTNGTDNHQELLPNNGWTWPKQTWLSNRLKERKEKSDERHD